MKPIYDPIKSIDARIEARNRRRMLLRELISATLAGLIWLMVCALLVMFSQ